MSSTGSSTRSSKVAPLILLKESMYNSLVKCLSGWAVQAVTGKLWKRKFPDTRKKNNIVVIATSQISTNIVIS